MKAFLIKYRWSLAAAAFGAVAGFLYWRLVGCRSGSCPIRSVWYWSTLWGAAAGYLLGDFIRDLVKKKDKNSGNNTPSERQG